MKKLGIVLSLLLTIGFIPAYADEEEPQVTGSATKANEVKDQAVAQVEENAAMPVEQKAEVKTDDKAETKVAVNFGDFKSSTLTTKAWTSLAKGDVESVLAYTNKTVELYGEQARKMET